jgi:hypothetical protein
MRILSCSLLLALLVTACGRCGYAPEAPIPQAAEREEERPRFVPAKVPADFPFELQPDDVVHASEAFHSDGAQVMDVQLETRRPLEEVAAHWEAELRRVGVEFERKAVEHPGFRSVILEGPTEAGDTARVSILQNDPIEGETGPLKVNIFWKKS